MRVSIQGVQVVRVGTEPLAKFACQGAHAGFAYVLCMRLIAENTISITRERNEKVNDLGIRHVALHEYALPSEVVMPERLHGWTRARHKRRVAEKRDKVAGIPCRRRAVWHYTYALRLRDGRWAEGESALYPHHGTAASEHCTLMQSQRHPFLHRRPHGSPQR